MATLDNSAARIVNVLELLRSHGSSTQAFDGWKSALGAHDDIELATRVADLFKPLAQTEAEIGKLPHNEDPEHVLAYFPALKELLAVIFQARSASIEHFQRQITDSTIYSIQTCAVALRRNSHRNAVLSDDGINEMVELIRQVIDEVSDSDLSENLKLFIIKRLRDVEAALQSVKVAGLDGVEDALDALLGGSMRNTPDRSPERHQVMAW